MVLREQTSCFKCGISGDETRLEVHHVIPPRGNEALFFDVENLAAVCPKCHKFITGIEIGSRKSTS
jgi:5-methylcytosine-specific restriction endonuclease McrA